ncbi:aspartate--tRNA ligase, mitochondrial isoform X2 [Apis cerana]|uniref:aspartate--tRNA ligase, mitochondrial isoform X2 n=1 Tax=Apis cerana TaxID=7461 RepID=UPI0007E2C4FF|nr:aspartate--tRNA ligase, mitochondrial isoform X2 [Apis cerana]
MFHNYIKSLYKTSLLFIDNLNNQKFITKYPLTIIIYTHDLAYKKQKLIKKDVQPVNKFVSRTHTCGELTIQNIGENVHLYGWLEFSRINKFLILRDSYGSTQLIIPEHKKDLQEIAKKLTFESVLSIEGKVLKRPKGQENKFMKTGDIEVEIKSIKVLNMANSNLPFIIRDYNKAKESTQMKYRYISLRYPQLQKNLRLRSKVVMKMREYLVKQCNFVDIETPTLFKNTPEGAQEFIVPTKFPGQFYSLVQSPQQFKQLLMVGGFDRYFQLARCYRDEQPRHDRQLEFTQLDIEMSFVDCEGIMKLIENLLAYSWPEEAHELTIPFKHMKYDNAMELYGTDKPDLRIPQQLYRLTESIDYSALIQNLKMEQYDKFEIYALVFSEKYNFLTKSVKDAISKLQSNYFPFVKLIQTKIPNKSSFITSIIKENVQQQLNLKEGDVLFLAYGEKVDTVKGLHYDLVMNGFEIAGGSIRIHKSELQKQILKMLNINESSLMHLLDALESGAPPHGGIAIGLDRLISLLCNEQNIKNVIAFPKTMTGRDLMSGAPVSISEEEKQLYHIRTINK